MKAGGRAGGARPSAPPAPPRGPRGGRPPRAPSPLPWRPQPGFSGTGPAQVSRPFVPMGDARPWRPRGQTGHSVGRGLAGFLKGTSSPEPYKRALPSRPRPPRSGHLDLEPRGEISVPQGLSHGRGRRAWPESSFCFIQRWRQKGPRSRQL